MLYRFPISIEKRDEVTEEWIEYFPKVHAQINKNTGGRGYEKLGAGAIQINRSLVFEVRYSPLIRAMAHNTQMFRIKYDGQYYDIIDYDDYQERHQNIKLTGAFYG